jgi:hypothetical protein
VVIENPHATNEPDERGTGPTDGVDDGRFTMSIEQFFRTYDLLRLATVEHAAEVGDFPAVSPGGPGTAVA